MEYLATDITLHDKDGNAINLSDLKNKLVFLNFGAWWCRPWRETLHDTMEMIEEYDDRIRFVFVGINFFIGDGIPYDPAEVQGRFEEQHAKYFRELASSTLHEDPEVNAAALEFFNENTYFDFRGLGQRLYRSYTDQRFGIPATFLIDVEGQVVFEAHNINQYWAANSEVLDAFINGEDLLEYMDLFEVEERVRLEE